MEKKNWITSFIGLLLLICLITPSYAALQTFDNGAEGWLNATVTDSGSIATTPSAWCSGQISGTVDNDSTRLYGIQAPFDTDFFGDLNGQQALTVDYKIDGTVTGPAGATVRFYLGHYDGQSRYWVSNDTFSWDPNGATDWTTYQVQLIESNFMLWPNQNTGDMTFDEVLLSYNDIGLVFADGFTSNATLGFSSTECATISIDNFGTLAAVPVPGAVWLLGSGLIGMAGIRKKSNRR